MQTFLPYPDYERSFACLDNNRIGNQVYREALTLIRGGWPNHPASKMWQGHFYELCNYALAGLIELQRRNRHYNRHARELFLTRRNFPKTGAPRWLGDPAFHASHRSNLLRKDPVWYSQFRWTEPDNLPYIWPKP